MWTATKLIEVPPGCNVITLRPEVRGPAVCAKVVGQDGQSLPDEVFEFNAVEEVEARIRWLFDDVTVGGESLSPSARGCKVSRIVDRATPARFADRSGASRTRGNRRTSHHVTVNGGGHGGRVRFSTGIGPLGPVTPARSSNPWTCCSSRREESTVSRRCNHYWTLGRSRWRTAVSHRRSRNLTHSSERSEGFSLYRHHHDPRVHGPARGLRIGFVDGHTCAPSAYPAVHHLTRGLRSAAGEAGDVDLLHLWAGSGCSSAVTGPAADAICELCAGA